MRHQTAVFCMLVSTVAAGQGRGGGAGGAAGLFVGLLAVLVILALINGIRRNFADLFPAVGGLVILWCIAILVATLARRFGAVSGENEVWFAVATFCILLFAPLCWERIHTRRGDPP